ncbi:hypothetical protein ACFX1T_004621 [Malus domestica]
MIALVLGLEKLHSHWKQNKASPLLGHKSFLAWTYHLGHGLGDVDRRQLRSATLAFSPNSTLHLDDLQSEFEKRFLRSKMSSRP